MVTRHLPTISYSGLTIILDKPSRFDLDSHRLIAGLAGDFFDQCIHPISRYACDIRLVDNKEPLLEGTKVILRLGDNGGQIENKELSLNELRGNPYADKRYTPTIPTIHTYSPQESFDRKNYEHDEEETEDGSENPKGHGGTKRRNFRWWMLHDCKKAVSICRHPELLRGTPQDFNVVIQPDMDSVCRTLKENEGQDLYLDIETTHGQVLTCIGFNFSNSPDIYVIPWKKYTNTLAYDPSLCRRFIQALCVSFGRNRVICHNAYFDLLVLCVKYRVLPPKKVFDTMLAWHRCYPEIEKSLGHLISFFLFEEYHKSDGVYHPKNAAQEQQLYNYNAKDVIRMRQCHLLLEKEIDKLGVHQSVERANRMLRPYMTMTCMGMKIDREKFIKRFDELDFKRLQINRCIGIITRQGSNFNPRSYQQVGDYLYNKLALPCPDEDNPTNSKTLRKLILKAKDHGKELPSVKLILYGRQIGKTASSMKFRLWPGIIHPNKPTIYDRFTTGYNIAGTDTFRLGSRAIFKYKRGTESDKKGWGTNAQNQDKDQRNLITADLGKKLGQVDQSGAEALIVSYLCRMGKFRELFIHGVKPHVFVALHVFKEEWQRRISGDGKLAIEDLCKLSPRNLKSHPRFKEVDSLIKSSDDWSADERYYYIAKMVCHAANYGMKAPTFQTNVLDKSEGMVVLTLVQCKEFLGYYHNLFPEIQEWHYSIRLELQNGRVLKNLFGEARRFCEPFGEELWKQGYAFKPQSTVGQITNYAITELQEGLDSGEIDPIIDGKREIGLDLLQNGHDSCLFQFWNNDKAELEACKEVASKMERELVSPRGEKFKMKVECQVGNNWGPYKVGKNEQGLKAYGGLN